LRAGLEIGAAIRSSNLQVTFEMTGDFDGAEARTLEHIQTSDGVCFAIEPGQREWIGYDGPRGAAAPEVVGKEPGTGFHKGEELAQLQASRQELFDRMQPRPESGAGSDVLRAREARIGEREELFNCEVQFARTQAEFGVQRRRDQPDDYSSLAEDRLSNLTKCG
jgi:hypothetical protein